MRLCIVLLLTGCPPPPNAEVRGAGQTAEGESRPRRAANVIDPAGGSCAGRSDCASDQACVDGQCRYRKTSIEGEALAVAAAAQREAGDSPSALQTYRQAIAAFESAHAPVPPHVSCEAAAVALDVHGEEQERERAAELADTCFRDSLPGFALRGEVLRRVGRLRYDGLHLANFDRDQPPDRFFTDQSSRPTVDAIEIGFDLPDSEEYGFDRVRDMIRGDDSRRIIADCFNQDWEVKHQRQARARMVLGFQVRMRDMGDWDLYIGSGRVTGTSNEADGFEPCLQEHLSALLAEGPRLARSTSWQVPIEISARLQ